MKKTDRIRLLLYYNIKSRPRRSAGRLLRILRRYPAGSAAARAGSTRSHKLCRHGSDPVATPVSKRTLAVLSSGLTYRESILSVCTVSVFSSASCQTLCSRSARFLPNFSPHWAQKVCVRRIGAVFAAQLRRESSSHKAFMLSPQAGVYACLSIGYGV